MSDFTTDIRESIAAVIDSNNPFTLGFCTDRGLAVEHARSLTAAIVEHDLTDDRALEAYDLCTQLVSYGRAF